jgi:hypothetical protein
MADVGDVCLSWRENTVALFVDEKTGIQAESRKHPTPAARPGRPSRRELEYRRRGTAPLPAALDVTTGKIKAADR